MSCYWSYTFVNLLHHGFNMENIKSHLSFTIDASRLETSMIYCYFGVINLLNLKAKDRDGKDHNKDYFQRTSRQRNGLRWQGR